MQTLLILSDFNGKRLNTSSEQGLPLKKTANVGQITNKDPKKPSLTFHHRIARDRTNWKEFFF